MTPTRLDYATTLFTIAAMFAAVPIAVVAVGLPWLLARPWAVLSGEPAPLSVGPRAADLRFELEPVAMDRDGRWKSLDELRYGPAGEV